LGFDTLFGIINYWNEIPEALRAAGAEVLVARVPATSSVEARAAELVKQIAKAYSGRSVHLIGHSMGGLDCRYLTKHLMEGAGFKVLSVSTMATPHRGSPAADLVVATHSKYPFAFIRSALPPPYLNLYPPLLPTLTFAFATVTEIPGFRGLLNMFPAGDGDAQAWSSLSTANTRTFNACTPDVPGVRYFSWGASFVPGIIDTLAWG
jgi:triacylglycerol lipase